MKLMWGGNTKLAELIVRSVLEKIPTKIVLFQKGGRLLPLLTPIQSSQMGWQEYASPHTVSEPHFVVLSYP